MSTVQDELIKSLRAHLKAGEVASPAKPATKVAATPTPAPVAGRGEVLYSSVFGYVPSMGDFPIRVLPPHSDPEVQRLVPAIDPDYVVQKEEAASLVAGIMDGDKSLLTGPTGSGKSSLGKYVAAKLNYPFIRINMSGDVESSSIFGTLVVEGGSTIWRDGAVTEAAKVGAICLIDEWELMPAEIAMGMQNVLEDGGYIYLKEKPGTSADRTVIPHESFRLVFAGNTVGQGDTTGAFNGVGVQNTATIDRFTNTIRLDYLDPAHEVSIIVNKAGVDKTLTQNMVKLASLVRNAYDKGKLGLTISPRTLINWGRKMKRYDVYTAFGVAYMQKLNDEDKVSVQELYRKVF